MTLRDALETAGLNAETVPGWGTRGGAWAIGRPVGIMEHHTALPVPFPVTRLHGTLLKANINTKPDGTVWLIAQRACNYSSGSGSSVVLGEVQAGTPPERNARERGLVDNINGNPWFFNFENDHPGDGSPMPQIQHDAIVTATRVVLDHYDLTPGNVISHAEWTARKRDPYWNGSLRAIEAIRQALEDTMPLTDADVEKVALAVANLKIRRGSVETSWIQETADIKSLLLAGGGDVSDADLAAAVDRLIEVLPAKTLAALKAKL